MILIFLIIVKLYFLIILKFFIKPQKIKSLCYKKILLFSGNKNFIKNFSLNNVIFNINKNNIYNFKIFYSSNKLGYYKKTHGFKLRLYNNAVKVECKNKSEITIVLIAKINNFNYIVNNFGIKQQNYKLAINKHCKTIVKNGFVKLVKTVKTKSLSFSYINTFSTMQNYNNAPYKGNFKLINAKQFNVDLLNNVVKIPNKSFNKNLLKTKYFNIKQFNNYYIINKKYYVYNYNNFTLISLSPINNLNCFSGSIKEFFCVKVYINKSINNQINNVLPQKILAEYKKQFNFQPFLYWLNINKQNPNSYVYKYFNLLNYYGVKDVKNNKVFLSTPSFSNNSVLVVINNVQLIIKNNSGKYSVLFNGIEYNNINYLNLNNCKTFVKNVIVW